MQPGSQPELRELNSSLEDPADDCRIDERGLSMMGNSHRDFALSRKISMAYLPNIGIATVYINSQMSHVLGDTEASL